MTIKQRPTVRYRKTLGYTHTVIGFVSLALLYVFPGSGGLFVIGVSSLGAAAVYFSKKDKLPSPVE